MLLERTLLAGIGRVVTASSTWLQSLPAFGKESKLFAGFPRQINARQVVRYECGRHIAEFSRLQLVESAAVDPTFATQFLGGNPF